MANDQNIINEKIKITSLNSINNTTTYYPNLYRYTNKMEGLVWVEFQPQKIKESQPLFARSSSTSKSLEVSDDGGAFCFLMPNTFSESFQHTWEPYESPLSSISEGLKSIAKGANQLENGFDVISDLKNIAKADGVSGKFNQALTNMKSYDYSTYFKMDTLLTYKDSARRQFDLQFELADTGSDDSPYSDVIYPVRALTYYSSPGTGGYTSGWFDKPYCFRITTYLSVYGIRQDLPNLIYYKYAALKGINPSYEGPYRNGYPCKGKLTLQFEDIEPLFKENITKSNSVTTSSSSTSNISNFFSSSSSSSSGNIFNGKNNTDNVG